MGDSNTPNLIGEKTELQDPKTGRFVKGNPGGGRPPGSVSIVEGIIQKLLEIEPGNKKTYLELFLSKLFLKAIKDGNEQLMRDMINRVDGMPKQTIDANIKEVKVIIKDVGNNTQHIASTQAETGTESE